MEYKREIGGTFDVFQIIGQLARVPPLVLLLTGAGIRSTTIIVGVLRISSSTIGALELVVWRELDTSLRTYPGPMWNHSLST